MQEMLGAMPKIDLDAVFKENPMYATKKKVVEQKKEPEPVPPKKEPEISPVMPVLTLLPEPELPDFTGVMMREVPERTVLPKDES